MSIIVYRTNKYRYWYACYNNKFIVISKRWSITSRCVKIKRATLFSLSFKIYWKTLKYGSDIGISMKKKDKKFVKLILSQFCSGKILQASLPNISTIISINNHSFHKNKPLNNFQNVISNYQSALLSSQCKNLHEEMLAIKIRLINLFPIVFGNITNYISWNSSTNNIGNLLIVCYFTKINYYFFFLWQKT